MDAREPTKATGRLFQIQRALLPTMSGNDPKLLHTSSQLSTIIDQDTPEDVEYPLSKAEVFSFLENVLAMSKPNELLERDRHEFLARFTLLMNTKIPFSNLHIISTPNLVTFRLPTLQECKEALLQGYGGNCFYINMFTKALLDLLGFKTFHVGANNPGDTLFDSHVSTIVCDLSHPGSQHLVDPGTIRPLFEAIPLDFEKESPVYQFNYVKVKFFKRDHGILLSCSQVPEPKKASRNIFEDEGCFWKIELIYRLHVPRSRAHWLDRIKYVYNFPSLDPRIHEVVCIFGFIGDRCAALCSDGKLFAMKLEHSDPSDVEVRFLSREEFVALVQKEFPQYPLRMIENAIANIKYSHNMNKY
ncbi:uncharacterized protein [Apostichopus japonicus]|uniref:uncharacterized protein n=1 Tax=Stichopus japonicus TaxID=307972 RepID=UPI003AB3E01F